MDSKTLLFKIEKAERDADLVEHFLKYSRKDFEFLPLKLVMPGGMELRMELTLPEQRVLEKMLVHRLESLNAQKDETIRQLYHLQ